MGVKFTVRTSSGLWIVLALMILLLPLPWFLAVIGSCLVHELWHLVAIKLCGVGMTGLRIGADGAYLETEPMTPTQGVICSLAGPIGALTLLLFARWVPRTALCAAVQTAYHLIPVYPLDGGRAFQAVTAYFGWDDRVSMITEGTILPLLAMGGVCLTVLGFGFFPLIVVGAIIFRVCREKYLANRAGTGYNIHTNF